MSKKTKSVLGVEKVIRQAWETTKTNVWFLIGIVLIISIANIIPSLISESVDSQFIAVLWSLVRMALSLWLTLGAIKILLDLIRKKSPKIEDLFSQGNHLLNFLVATILYNLIVLGGLILLIVPGIIWAIKFQFFTYFIVDKGMGPIEALKASSQITRGDKWNLLLLGIMVFLLNILGLLLLVVGLLVTYPLTMLAVAYAYLDLKRAKFKQEPENSPTTS